MQSVAVVYFPKIDLARLNAFREMYDPGWKIIDPHITIVSPVFEISENQLIEHVESTVKGIKSFYIHLTGLTKTSDSCLFLMVKEGVEEIADLHVKLYSEISHPYIPTEYPFEPHITLGDFTTTDDKLFAKAYSEAKDLKFDMSCTFDAVSVIKGDGVSPAKIVKTINLHN